MIEQGVLEYIAENATSIKDFHHNYSTWDSFLFVNKRDLLPSFKIILENMLVFQIPDEKLLSEHPLITEFY